MKKASRFWQYTVCIIPLLLSAAISCVQAQSSSAIDTLRQSLTVETNDSLRSRLANAIARNYVDVDTDSARYYSNQSIEYAEKFNEPNLLGFMFHYACWLHGRLDRHDLANQNCEKAKKYYLAGNNYKQYVRAGINIGFNHWRAGNLELGITSNLKLIEHCDSFGQTDQSPIIMLNTALMYTDLGQPKKAENLYLQIIPAAKKIGDKKLLALAYNNLSIRYRHQEKFIESSALLKKALSLAEEINFVQQIGRSYSNLGANYTQMMKYDSALVLLDTAIVHQSNTNNNGGLVKCYWHKGEALLAMKDFKNAQSMTEKSLSLAKEIGAQRDYIHAYEQMMDIFKMWGKPKEAYRYMDSVVMWKDSLVQLNINENLANAEARYKTYDLKIENIKKQTLLLNEQEKRKNQLYIFLISVLSGIIFISWYLYHVWKRRQAQLLVLEEQYAQSSIQQIELMKKELAAQLHDDIGQDLVLAKQNAGEDAEQVTIIDRALQKIRTLSRTEYPHNIEYLGLRSSIEEMIDQVEHSTQLIVSESIDSLPKFLSTEQAITIYRIFQESLSNTIKHASATSAYIGVERSKEYLMISYKDNGESFDFESQIRKKKALGLKQIIDRLRILNAEIVSLPTVEDGNQLTFKIALDPKFSSE